MLGLRLKNYAIANQVERLVLRRTLPAFFGRTEFGFDVGIKGVLPCSWRNARIASSKIRLGDEEIQMRLAKGFIAGVEKSCGLRTVASAQTFLFARRGIVDVEHATLCPPVESESIFHGSNFLVRAC